MVNPISHILPATCDRFEACDTFVLCDWLLMTDIACQLLRMLL